MLGAIALAALHFSAGALEQAQQGTTNIGILPHLSTRVLLRQYQPLSEYLARSLNRPVHILTAPNFKDFYHRTDQGEYDLVITAPHFAGLAEKYAGYRPLLVFYPEIQGLIIHEKANPLADVEDLRGKTLVVPNPKSLVANKGLVWLAEHKLRAEQDFRVLNTVNQDSAGDMVLNGEGVAAMLSNGEFQAIPETLRERLSVFAVFVEIPGFVVMSSPRIDDAESERLAELLLAFADRSPERDGFFQTISFNGMRRLSDADLLKLHSYMDITKSMLGLDQ